MEYWFLEVVSAQVEPVQMLVSDEDSEEGYFGIVFNRAPHGLSNDDVIEYLSRMFDAGLLTAWQSAYIPFRSQKSFVATREQIAQAIRSPRHQATEDESPMRLWYGLSAKGGRRWEELTKPDWSRFVFYEEGRSPENHNDFFSGFDFDEGDDGPDNDHDSLSTNEATEYTEGEERVHIRLSSANSSLAKFFLDQDHVLYRLVDPDSITRTIKRPWSATYWKMLPRGYILQYSLLPESSLKNRKTTPSSYGEVDKLRQRWTPHWYTDYITQEPAG